MYDFFNMCRLVCVSKPTFLSPPPPLCPLWLDVLHCLLRCLLWLLAGFATSKVLRVPTTVALLAAWMAELLCKVGSEQKNRRVSWIGACLETGEETRGGGGWSEQHVCSCRNRRAWAPVGRVLTSVLLAYRPLFHIQLAFSTRSASVVRLQS